MLRRYFKCIYTLKRAVPALSSAHLLNYLQHGGWTIIFSDQDVGRTMLKKFGLEGRAENNPAFTAKSGRLRLVVTRQKLPERDKCRLLLHETGHILLCHNVSCLSVAEEREAEIFTRIGICVYGLWKYRWWISAAGAAVVMFMALGIISMEPTGCSCSCRNCCK